MPSEPVWSTGRQRRAYRERGLRVPAEPLNSLKYNQPSRCLPAAGERIKSCPPPNQAWDQGPGGEDSRRGPSWLLGEEAGQQERAARRGAILPAAATLRPGQPKSKGQETLSPHRGKPSPRGSNRGPAHQGGLPQLRATSIGPVLISHFLAPKFWRGHLHPRRDLESPAAGGQGDHVLFLQLLVPL